MFGLAANLHMVVAILRVVFCPFRYLFKQKLGYFKKHPLIDNHHYYYAINVNRC